MADYKWGIGIELANRFFRYVSGILQDAKKKNVGDEYTLHSVLEILFIRQNCLFTEAILVWLESCFKLELVISSYEYIFIVHLKKFICQNKNKKSIKARKNPAFLTSSSSIHSIPRCRCIGTDLSPQKLFYPPL